LVGASCDESVIAAAARIAEIPDAARLQILDDPLIAPMPLILIPPLHGADAGKATTYNYTIN
jgi:hypothetical protein